MGEVLNNGVYLPDRGERNAYDGLKGNWNTLDSIAGKVPGYDGHISDTDIHVTAADKQTWNGKADASHVHNANDVTTGVFDAARIPNLDASKITTGTIDIDRLPQGALERLVKVADQAARYALTASDVQLGDTVQQLDTGVMYVVTDETKLDSADGYTEYTAGSATSVPWSGVTGKPADYTPASHSHGNITNDGKVGTAANKPLITGTGGAVQAGSFGNAANTFCEGNDSRLSDARTPVAHTHTKSDITNLFNSANNWTGENTYSKTVAIERNTDTGSFLALKNSVAELGSTPASATPATIAYPDKNNDNLGYMGMFYDTDGSNRFRLYVRNKFTSGTLDTSGTTDYTTFQLRLNADQSKEGVLRGTFRPYDNNTYDLGSSTYQWNSLYAKNYFYNGTQWGLDRANTWTAQNSFNSDLNLNYASTDVDDIVNSVAGSATLDNFVHMTGDETVNGIKSFPDGVVANVTGSATSATNDGSGNVISITYGKLGADNTWSGQNTYSDSIKIKKTFTVGEAPVSDQFGGLGLTNGSSEIGNFSVRLSNTGTTWTRVYVGNKFANGALDPNGSWKFAELQVGVRYNGDRFIYTDGFWRSGLFPYVDPGESESYMVLGDSNHQWFNLYAKNYYYNGTQWGLDKANVWNTYQTIKGYYLGNEQSTNGRTCLYLTSNRDTVGQSGIYITKFRQNRAQGAMNPADLQYISFDILENSIRTNGALQLNVTNWNNDVPSGAVLYSSFTNAQLGSSLAPWKTLNGVNPGSLSFPSGGTTENTDWYNVAGDILPTGGNATNFTGGQNFFTPSKDGWLALSVVNCESLAVWISSLNYGLSVVAPNTNENRQLIIPVVAGKSIEIKVKGTRWHYARLIVTQGNV